MKCSTVSLLVLCGMLLVTYAESGHSKFEPKTAALYDPSDGETLRGYAGFQAYFFNRNQVCTCYASPVHDMLGQNISCVAEVKTW